jgi:putative ABC transport system substrate-binding protein
VADDLIEAVKSAASARGLQVHVLNASAGHDFNAVFDQTSQRQASGLIISSDAFFTSQVKQLAGLALQYRVPAVYPFSEFAGAGGLMAYGASNTEGYRQVGVYTGRILKGEKAAELPVQQATKVELVINLKTAKALGITVPPPLLARANELIE